MVKILGSLLLVRDVLVTHWGGPLFINQIFGLLHLLGRYHDGAVRSHLYLAIFTLDLKPKLLHFGRIRKFYY
jgi:hypothetical protein